MNSEWSVIYDHDSLHDVDLLHNIFPKDWFLYILSKDIPDEDY